MDNPRLFLFIALSVVIMLLFSAWQEQYAPKQQQSPVAGVPTDQPLSPGSIDNSPSVPSNDDIPSVQPQATVPSAPSAAAPGVASTIIDSRQRIVVLTDLLRVEIDTLGGDIRKAALLKYPKKLKNPDDPVVLFNDEFPVIMIAQSGLLANVGSNVDHHVVFSADKTQYHLSETSESISVILKWKSDDGFSVNKIYTFHRDNYVIDMEVEVQNDTGQDWSGRLYRQLQRNDATNQEQSAFIYTYTGGVVSYENNKYEKVSFDDMATWKPEASYVKAGWVAMIEHYFLGAWIPVQDQYNYFYTKVLDNGRYMIGISSAERKIAAGESGQFSSKLYIGPKEQDRLATIAPNLQLTVDYGVLTILADPVFWLLKKIHHYIGNWGWAIIFVTLIIKLVFYKLSEAAYRSMANMRKFQPKIQALRERYGGDRQRMSQAMMEIYKKEKINPLGGCLPMLVQIPVFIALYWVLLESVELRQAPFILWINDLSSKDPYYVLPVLMGVSMFIQQKLNPAPMDPMQQKILSFLPIVFTLFFAFFPSGLVLYWVANNILSIMQQWYITRKIEQTA
ncbi:MAG: membrane protein insertase YidC [Gammaproteobacteria bacterium]|nr:membrane protein insertase YidC [Gammaproteobacteria bacterium]